jgi:hypothetical protein
MLKRVTGRILELVNDFKEADRNLIFAFFPKKAVKSI